MPRYYTIASSNLKYPDEVRIAISLSTHTVPLTLEARYGLASQYLNDFFEKGY